MKNVKFISSAIAMLVGLVSFAQQKNYLDKSYLEVSGQADTLVLPDKIWIAVLLTEKDTRGKKSVEDLEKEMIKKLDEIGIDVEKNLTIQDMSSNFKSYFLKQTDILKAKSYSILTKDATTASKIFIGLEAIGISNVSIEKTENSNQKNTQLIMNSKAMEDAKQNAISFTKPLHQKLGNAIHISGFSELSNQLAGSVNGIRIRGLSSIGYASEMSKIAPNIEFEKIKISSSIQVQFSLE